MTTIPDPTLTAINGEASDLGQLARSAASMAAVDGVPPHARASLLIELHKMGARVQKLIDALAPYQHPARPA